MMLFTYDQFPFSILLFLFNASEKAVKSGFILNLENLENKPFLRKVRETWNSQGIFHNCHPSQGAVREELLGSHIMFSNSLHGCSLSGSSIFCQ